MLTTHDAGRSQFQNLCDAALWYRKGLVHMRAARETPTSCQFQLLFIDLRIGPCCFIGVFPPLSSNRSMPPWFPEKAVFDFALCVFCQHVVQIVWKRSASLCVWVVKPVPKVQVMIAWPSDLHRYSATTVDTTLTCLFCWLLCGCAAMQGDVTSVLRRLEGIVTRVGANSWGFSCRP